jgi:hypothetical protein
VFGVARSNGGDGRHYQWVGFVYFLGMQRQLQHVSVLRFGLDFKQRCYAERLLSGNTSFAVSVGHQLYEVQLVKILSTRRAKNSREGHTSRAFFFKPLCSVLEQLQQNA